MENQENTIEFLATDKTATASFTSQKFINRCKKLYAGEHKEQFVRFFDNKDGSVCCTFPLNWVKIMPPRKMTDEEKLELAERLQKARNA